MPDPQRATGTDLKQAILDEARRVLEESGYTAISTRRIASAVGCTATSIYLYFKSKDALIYALIEEGFEELNARMMRAVKGEGTIQERLERAADAYIRFGLDQTPYYEIMFTLRAEQMERYPAASYRRARATLDAFAQVAEMEPELGLLAGTTIWSGLHGLVSLLIARRIDIRIDREALIQHTIHATCTAALAQKNASALPSSPDAGTPNATSSPPLAG
ncbi:Fatty acid metabolism regulator protein [Planctomycetes bacterium Poly30]|uniref:Fatty acid metabolism regulator protein n=1 Tax=Saltatorellus ferox TaxID=2528018 RepID=A0A518EPF0_9BACT|nr:Fatty acid metabolism regulator protein [Planctomycetes bacterium Poly30]